MPPSSSSNGGRLCSPDSGIYNQSHKHDEISSLSSFYIPPHRADAAATVSDLQQFKCSQQVSSRLAAAVQRAVLQQWRCVGVRGQANLRHHHCSSQILRLALCMAGGGGQSVRQAAVRAFHRVKQSLNSTHWTVLITSASSS